MVVTGVPSGGDEWGVSSVMSDRVKWCYEEWRGWC